MKRLNLVCLSASLLVAAMIFPVIVMADSTASMIIDHSGSVATGGTSQVIMTQSYSRHGFIFQNLSSATEWLLPYNGFATQSRPSIAIYPSSAPFITPPGFVPQGQISVIGATAGQSYLAEEY